MTVTFVTPEDHQHSLHLNAQRKLGLELCPHAFRPDPSPLATFTIKVMYIIAEENTKEITLKMAKLLPFIRKHRLQKMGTEKSVFVTFRSLMTNFGMA